MAEPNPKSPPPADQSKWFLHEVHPHQPSLRAIAERNNCAYVDIHTPQQTVFAPLTPDGGHLLSDGQGLIARLILAEGLQVGVFPQPKAATRPPRIRQTPSP